VKILYSATSYPPAAGGGQYYTHLLAQYVQQQHDVQVVTHWDENRTDWLLGTTLRAPQNCKDYNIDGVPVHQIGVPREVRWSILPLVLTYYALEGLAIDVISNYLHNQIAQHVDVADLVHNVRIGREGLSFASYKLARAWDVPFVLSPLHHPRWVGWLYRHYHELYRRADGLLALTQNEKRTLAALGADEDKIFVTGMGPILGADPQPRRFAEQYNLDGPMVLFLGQKYRYKNFGTVLEAAPLVWSEMSDVTFVFIGPRTSYSVQRFETISDPRIIEIGWVDLAEKTDALAACDLLCVPSSQESFGGVYVEAWTFEKPVIGGDAPAVAEVIEHGQSGFIVSPDPTEIANRILTLLRNPELRANMGAVGKQKTLEYYTWDKLGAKTEAIYRKLLDG